MARKAVKLEDKARVITVEKDYGSWKTRNKISDEKAFKAMAKVRNAYERSRSYLMTSCFHDSFQETSSAAGLSGGSWYDRRTKQEKMAIMWYRQPSVEDFISNIKSPMSRGRINTFVNWMKKINLEFGAKPNNRDDRNAAIMADKTTNYWMQNSNARSVLGDAWEDLATHGNSILRLSYVKEYKDYRFPKTTGLTDEEKTEIDEGKRKVVYSAPERTLIIDDIVLEHVPINEIYPDPSARSFHGDTYRAGWVIRKRYVTLDYLKAIYEDHPNVKYLDKVKGGSAYKDDTEYFFEPPRDIMGEDVVELLEMEDQDNDCYYVVANDIGILGCHDEEPLPYGHKEISYHKLDFIRVPGQFFSIGICDLLDNIQSSFEVALNMVADYIYRTYNYKLLVEADNYGEIKQSIQRTGDMFIPIDTSDGKPLGSKVMPLVVSPIGFDIFQFLELLERNATLATNIDPAQMALLAGSKTATSDILNKELLMTMIGGVVENNINGDLRNIGRQLWKLQQQHYSKPRVRRIVGEKKETFEKRTIRFENMELVLDDDTSLLTEKELEGDYSFFEITDKYLSTREEVDIFIKPESKEVQSQSLEEQRMAEEFAQLMPFAVDPNNPQQVSQHQMPMVDATELFKEYFTVKRIPQKLMLDKSGSNSQSIKEAEKHVMQILSGKHAPSTPGQSTPHLEYEYKVLDALLFQRDEKMKDMEKDLQKQVNAIMQQAQGMPQFDPYTGEPMPMPQPIPNENLMNEVEKLEEVIEKLQKHLTIESMPASMRQSRILQMDTQAAAPPPESGMMEAPMPNGGANQISPEMVNSVDPASQVPMGAAPMAPSNPMMQQPI